MGKLLSTILILRLLFRPLTLATLILIPLGTIGRGASAAIDPDIQAWSVLFAQKNLDDFRLYFEVQPRLTRDVSVLDRVLIRPAVGFEFAPGHSVWLGYLWSLSTQNGGNHEQRFWQQYLNQRVIERWTLFNRIRLEQRFIQNVGDTAWRVRHQFRALYALDSEKIWSAAVFNELFFNLNSVSSGPQSGFDQNRFFIGVSRLFGPQLRVEPGYLLNYVYASGDRPNPLNHTFYVMVAYFIP